MAGRPFGYKHTEETKRKIGDAHIGLKWSDETKEKIRQKQLGVKESDETKAKLRALWTPEHRALMSSIRKKQVVSEETKRKISLTTKGKPKSESCKEKHRQLWKNKEHAIRQLWLQRRNIKPNKPEKIVFTVLNAMYPNEWDYTGNGKILIERLNPDFINVNGKKLIIEVFGDYWHKDGVANGTTKAESYRRKVFSKYGYDMLVLWEKDIKGNINKVESDIKCFMEAHHQ